MNNSVLVYKSKEIAAYGFEGSHPFGTDRHDVFHAELSRALLDEFIDFGSSRPASLDELLSFHTAEYLERVSRLSSLGKGFFDNGDTPVVKGIYESSLAVVGTVLDAVDKIMNGDLTCMFS